jgi:hypothetical protein
LISSFLAANVAAAATNTPGQHHSQKKHSGQHHNGAKKHSQHSGTHKKNANKHNGQ